MTAFDQLEILYAEERIRLESLPASAEKDGAYTTPVFGCGNPGADVLLVGEAPGAEETLAGRPFVGKAGKQLDALLSRIGVDRDAIYITNVVKYRPVVQSARSVRNRTPDKTEWVSGLPLLRAELLTICPRLIVTLGNTPLSAVRTLASAAPATIGAVHGASQQLQLDTHTFIHVPLYHPASGIYNRALVEVMERDIEQLGGFLTAMGIKTHA